MQCTGAQSKLMKPNLAACEEKIKFENMGVLWLFFSNSVGQRIKFVLRLEYKHMYGRHAICQRFYTKGIPELSILPEKKHIIAPEFGKFHRKVNFSH